jgi:hypothetical protein
MVVFFMVPMNVDYADEDDGCDDYSRCAMVRQDKTDAEHHLSEVAKELKELESEHSKALEDKIQLEAAHWKTVCDIWTDYAKQHDCVLDESMQRRQNIAKDLSTEAETQWLIKRNQLIGAKRKHDEAVDVVEKEKRAKANVLLSILHLDVAPSQAAKNTRWMNQVTQETSFASLVTATTPAYRLEPSDLSGMLWDVMSRKDTTEENWSPEIAALLHDFVGHCPCLFAAHQFKITAPESSGFADVAIVNRKTGLPVAIIEIKADQVDYARRQGHCYIINSWNHETQIRPMICMTLTPLRAILDLCHVTTAHGRKVLGHMTLCDVAMNTKAFDDLLSSMHQHVLALAMESEVTLNTS